MRPSRVLPVAAALLLAVAPAAADARAATAQRAAAELPADASLRVMTWNIHFGVSPDKPNQPNLDPIRDEIAAEDPDVVALQEIHREHDGDPGNPDDGPHGDQIVEMEEKLGDLGYVDFFATPEGKQGKLIASKYPLTDTGLLDLPKDDHGKQGTVAYASVARDGQDVRVFSAHLQNPKDADAEALRDKEVRHILEKVRRLNEPVLLTGDFNLRPDDPMKSVIANRGFVDTWTTVRNSEAGVTTTGGHDGSCRADIDKVKRIDYVFASPAIVTEDGHVACGTRASDHKPVVMRVHVEPRPIEVAGSLRAGDLGRAGWAHLTVFTDRTSRLLVCDNQGGDWRVTARGYRPYQGVNFVQGSDGGSDRGMCQSFDDERPAGTMNVALKTCVKNKHTDEIRDCRKHGLLERTYLGADSNAGYVQYRVGVDNGVTVEACDMRDDGRAVRGIAENGDGDVVSWAADDGADGKCASRNLPWAWSDNGLDTRTCFVQDGQESGCVRKAMAYAH